MASLYLRPESEWCQAVPAFWAPDQPGLRGVTLKEKYLYFSILTLVLLLFASMMNIYTKPKDVGVRAEQQTTYTAVAA